MKRPLALSMLVVFGVAVVAYQPVNADKTLVCHIEDTKGVGHVIEVSDSAVPAHLNHGDCPTVLPPDADCSCLLQ